jgi:hypothetical protein
MRNALLPLIALTLLVPLAGGQEKESPDKAALAKAVQDADAVFTATIEKVKPISQTNSIPPSIRGEVTFKDVKPLRGKAEGETFAYTFKKGTTKNLELDAKGQVLVAIKQKAAMVIVPATEANLGLVKKEGGEK